MKGFTVFLFMLLLTGCSDSKPSQEPPKASPVASSSPIHLTDEQLRAAGTSDDEIAMLRSVEGEKWYRSEIKDPMDDHKVVQFEISSKTPSRTHKDASAASLQVSCGKYLIVDALTGPVQTLDVRTRLDDGPVVSERWSSLKDQLISREPKVLIKKLLKAKSFRLEFTPSDGIAQVAVFNLADLNEVFMKEPLCKSKFQ